MQALQSTTFNPARLLAELDKFGVVETGHAADLVLPEANPLAPNLTPSSPRSLSCLRAYQRHRNVLLEIEPLTLFTIGPEQGR
jgi:cytosine/adenosine deaminase-related metal-dependent hydrolase